MPAASPRITCIGTEAQNEAIKTNRSTQDVSLLRCSITISDRNGCCPAKFRLGEPLDAEQTQSARDSNTKAIQVGPIRKFDFEQTPPLACPYTTAY